MTKNHLKLQGIFLLIFLFSNFNCIAQKQSGIAVYNATTNFSFEHVENEKEKVLLNRIFEDSGKESPVNFKLIFKDNESIFFAGPVMNRDDDKIDFVNINARILGKIYSNIETNELIHNKEDFGENFNVYSSLSRNKWIITNKKLKIGKYLCFQAILKNEKNNINQTIAWFTKDIPVKMGPFGYCGLPGFIVLLKDDIFIYALKEITFGLDKKDEKLIKKPSIGLEVSIKEYDSIYKLMRDKKERLEMENSMGN